MVDGALIPAIVLARDIWRYHLSVIVRAPGPDRG